MNAIILLLLLLVVVCTVNSQTVKPTTKPISTDPPGPGYPGNRDGARPWGFFRRRQPRMQYNNYYYDYYGMSRGCSCSPFQCRRRYAFRGRCRTNGYERHGFRCCYSGFRRDYEDYDFDFYD